MPEQVMLTDQDGTLDIAPDRWIMFMSEFTRENRGSHATLQVLGSDAGRVIPTEDKPFDGISADRKDGENTVWITFGYLPDDRLTHGVQNVISVRVRPPSGRSGAVVEIEAEDQTRTLLELTRREDYALPPGEAQTRT